MNNYISNPKLTLNFYLVNTIISKKLTHSQSSAEIFKKDQNKDEIFKSKSDEIDLTRSFLLSTKYQKEKVN